MASSSRDVPDDRSAWPSRRAGWRGRASALLRWVQTLRVDRTRPIDPALVRIDNECYDAMADGWWAANGPAVLLHSLNPVRTRFFLDAVGIVPDGLVLDAGCGGGLIARELVAAGARVIGMDRSTQSLRVARAAAVLPPDGGSARGLGALGGFLPVGGALEQLPFADGAFAAVIAGDVLEHVTDLPAAVSELSRVLAPGGHMLVDTVNRTPWAWIVVCFGAERLTRLAPRHTHDWRLFIRPQELDRLAAAAGLQLVARAGMAPRLEPAALLGGLVFGRVPVPSFRRASGLRVSWLGHYRKLDRSRWVGDR